MAWREGVPPMVWESERGSRAGLPPGTRTLAHRWYVPRRALPWASDNAKGFHRWLLNLKTGHQQDVFLAACLLVEICERMMWVPDLVVSCPGAGSVNEVTPLAVVAQAAAEALGCEAGGDVLVRTRDIPPAVTNPGSRDAALQESTMGVGRRLPSGMKLVLVLDDVVTTGSTMTGALRRLHPHVGGAEIIGLGFGKTMRTGSVEFPEWPRFMGWQLGAGPDVARKHMFW